MRGNHLLRIVRTLLIILGLTGTGAALGWVWGTIELRKLPEYWAGESISEDDVPRAGLTVVGGLLGLAIGATLAAAIATIGPGSMRFDLVLDPAKCHRVDVDRGVAMLLGLDPRSARRLVDSGSPLLRQASLGQAGSLCHRFADFGVATSIRCHRASDPANLAARKLASQERNSLGKQDKLAITAFTPAEARVMATVGLRLGPADHGRRMTLAEFQEADAEEGYRYELSRGVLEVTEVPNDPHGQVVSNCQGLLHHYHRQHPGLIQRIGGGGEFRLYIPEFASGRNPDVAVVLVGTPKNERGRRPPSLVAEVVSKRGEVRDYQEKREEYWAFGVREYWIIDPAARRVLLLNRREGEQAWTERELQGSDVIASELLPGFAGTVAELWQNLDGEL